MARARVLAVSRETGSPGRTSRPRRRGKVAGRGCGARVAGAGAKRDDAAGPADAESLAQGADRAAFRSGTGEAQRGRPTRSSGARAGSRVAADQAVPDGCATRTAKWKARSGGGGGGNGAGSIGADDPLEFHVQHQRRGHRNQSCSAPQLVPQRALESRRCRTTKCGFLSAAAAAPEVGPTGPVATHESSRGRSDSRGRTLWWCAQALRTPIGQPPAPKSGCDRSG